MGQHSRDFIYQPMPTLQAIAAMQISNEEKSELVGQRLRLIDQRWMEAKEPPSKRFAELMCMAKDDITFALHAIGTQNKAIEGLKTSYAELERIARAMKSEIDRHSADKRIVLPGDPNFRV